MPPARQDSHTRSMFAWCNQKIGSRAAVDTSPMNPTRRLSPTTSPLPPMALWTLLCGVPSRAPDPHEQVTPHVRGLPKPSGLGVGGEVVNDGVFNAAMMSAADSVSWV